jgi:hypothetical protein
MLPRENQSSRGRRAPWRRILTAPQAFDNRSLSISEAVWLDESRDGLNGHRTWSHQPLVDEEGARHEPQKEEPDSWTAIWNVETVVARDPFVARQAAVDRLPQEIRQPERRVQSLAGFFLTHWVSPMSTSSKCCACNDLHEVCEMRANCSMARQDDSIFRKNRRCDPRSFKSRVRVERHCQLMTCQWHRGNGCARSRRIPGLAALLAP